MLKSAILALYNILKSAIKIKEIYMYNHLYDNFKHWYQGGQIYFYSDPHFNDKDNEYMRPNYIGDDEQVKSINSKIGKKDTIVILGDIGDISFIKKIRGYKILIMGNHDVGASKYTGEYGLFNEVYEGPVFISDRILLSHEPIDYPYALNIHGHDHSNWSYQDDLHMNMCAEHINYTPVPLKQIIKSGKLKTLKIFTDFILIVEMKK
jgi:calcineurin-like phosphoesterase family protein